MEALREQTINQAFRVNFLRDPCPEKDAKMLRHLDQIIIETKDHMFLRVPRAHALIDVYGFKKEGSFLQIYKDLQEFTDSSAQTVQLKRTDNYIFVEREIPRRAQYL